MVVGGGRRRTGGRQQAGCGGLSKSSSMLQLLFFDTFSHDNAGGGVAKPELNLDLVQFPSPVYVSEVRVIPLGSRVTANFPGGVRLGATNPSSFQLEFFVNNLKAPGASTFEAIGTLQYSSSSCISLPISASIATDGLVLRGHYSTITLAVYGSVSDATPDQLARQGETKTEPVKEEAPELELPSTPVGESYAAQWTEKHKQVALKAEPPDEWGDLGPAEPVKEEPNSSPRPASTTQWRKYNDGFRRSSSWDRNGERSPDTSRRRGSDRTRSRERSPRSPPKGTRSPRGRERTPRSRDLSPRDRDRSPRGRSPLRDRTPRRDRPRSVSRGPRSLSPSRRSLSRDPARSLSRDRAPARRTRSRSRTPELVLHYSKSREASLEKGPRRSLSREPSTRKGSRDGWGRASREEQDRTSLHSGGSRRISPPRSSLRGSPSRGSRGSLRGSPSRGSRGSLRGSPSRCSRGSLSPRRSDSRSSYRLRRSSRSRSRDRRSLGSPPRGQALSPLPPRRSLGSPPPRRSEGSPLPPRPTSQPLNNSTNGCHSPPDSQQPARKSTTPPREDNVLDNVSDISDGDIPDLPEAEVEQPPIEAEVSEPMQVDASATEEEERVNSMVREDVEEISDEEAEWSDDVETTGFSDFEVEQLGADLSWEDFDRETISVFDCSQWEEGREGLATFSCPTETLCDRVRAGKVTEGVSCENATSLEETLFALETMVVDDKWVEGVEAVSRIVQMELPGCLQEQLVRDQLVKVAATATNFDKAMEQQKPTHKVRHIKSGLKLALLATGLQSRLLGLLGEKHMATSVSLLILRTLASTLDSAYGLQRFLASGGYNKLVALAETAQLQTRTKFAVSSLLSKCHLGELLTRLATATGVMGGAVNGHSSEGGVDLEGAAQCLHQVAAMYKTLETTMSHPPRHLPSSRPFNLSSTEFCNPEASYFSVIKSGGLLEVLGLLLSHPTASDCEPVAAAVQDLISTWLRSEHGLLFLAASPRISAIVRALLAETVEEGPTCGTLLGEELVHMVTAVRHLDTIATDIRRADNVRVDMETPSTLAALLALYGMTFTARGRDALVRVLTTSDHLDCLLELCRHSSQEGKKDMKKSAIRGFASELLLLCVRSSEDMDWLQRYGTQLFELGRHDEHSKLSELALWCSPLQELGMEEAFTEDSVPGLVEILNRQLEVREGEERGNLGSDAVTACRILKWMIGPRTEDISVQQSPRLDELKFHHATVTMFSADLLATLTNLLGRISSEHEQPGLHMATFVGTRGANILAIIKPAISILKTLLSLLVKCRDTAFRDISCVGALLRTHTLLSVVPESSLYHEQAVKSVEELILTLLAYTQPNVDLSKNNMGKSSWTLMVGEVVTHITSSPQTYLSGLTLFSSLLPLPTASSPEVQAVSTGRKLWSAHLHPLSDKLTSMIGTLAGLSHPPVISALEQLCRQLASLAPPTARLVVSGVVIALGDLGEDDHQQVEVGLMRFLAWCLKQPALKAVFCDLIKEERTKVINCLQRCLLSSSASPSLPAAQTHCVGAIRSLIDPSVTLREEGDDAEQVLADSLPDKESLVELFQLLVSHLGTDSTLPCIEATLATLKFSHENPHTLALQQSALLNSSTRPCLASLLRRLAVELSPDQEMVMSCLSATLHLITGLSTSFSATDLALALTWSSPEDSQSEAAERRRTHPLAVLSNRLKEQEGGEKEELTSIQSLLSKLDSVSMEGVREAELEEVSTLPEPSPLLLRWSGVKATDGEGGLSLPTWAQASQKEVEDPGPAGLNLPTVDLMAISSKYLETLDLVAEARNVTREKTLATERKKKGVKKSLMETKTLHNKNIISNFKAGGSVSIRGRGFSRSSFRPDPFRARPPNTSRPPSLHVDDFLVLELKGQQPTGPTGYNKQSIKAAKELFAARDAENALKPPAQLREATREPVVPYNRGRGRGERGGGGRGFRGSNGATNRNFNRRDSRGWSPEGPGSFPRAGEPRDMGREARPGPREDGGRRGGGNRGGFRGGGGDRRGGGPWGGDRGGGRGERRFGRGGRGGGGDRDDRVRHIRSMTR